MSSVLLRENAEALSDLARWWAVEMAGNEVGFRDGYRPPELFLRLVARELVANPLLGWPDEESARGFLDELYPARDPR